MEIIFIMKNAVFWDVAPGRSCVNRHLGGTYGLHLQCIKIRERGTSVNRWLQRYFTPKRRFTQVLHGATSQKTAFFIVTATNTSILQYSLSLLYAGGDEDERVASTATCTYVRNFSHEDFHEPHSQTTCRTWILLCLLPARQKKIL
jgi:hypothetical protein